MIVARIPPRPVAPGDLITGWSVDLGEWTAAQVTFIHDEWDYVGVLDLPWSGPEPAAMADVAELQPLRKTFGQWRNAVAHLNVPWLLPRSARVIGSRPLLVDRPSNAYGGSWNLGTSLACQRLHDAGAEDRDARPWTVTVTGRDLADGRGAHSRRDVREVRITDVTEVDCALVIERFPQVQRLFVDGALGTLSNASHLNRLHDLREVYLTDVFGMTDQDVLKPTQVPLLEVLAMSGIPKDYAAGTRTLWRKEVQRGTALEVRGARTPEWLAENRTNPIRDWDTREHITAREYQRALKEYRRTRAAIVGAFAAGPPAELPAAMERIGVDFAQSVNAIAARTHFVETEEREDLLMALAATVNEAGGEHADGPALDALLHAVNAHRDW